MSRYDADDTYCYPGSDVLRYKAELTDLAKLILERLEQFES